MLKKGMVIKIKNKYALVATEDSSISRIKIKDGLYVGQKLYFDEEDLVHTSRPIMGTSNRQRPVMALALAACLLFALVLINPFGDEDLPLYALITVDINPSFEIGIDENYKVLSIRAVNEDSQQIVDQGLVGVPLDDAIRETILDVQSSGLNITDKSAILVSTVVIKDQAQVQKDKRPNRRLEEEVVEGLDEAFDQAPEFESGKIVFVDADNADIEAAAKTSLSVGKYKLIEMSEAADKYTLLESESVGDLIQRKDIAEDILKDSDSIIMDGEDLERLQDYIESHDLEDWFDDFEDSDYLEELEMLEKMDELEDLDILSAEDVDEIRFEMLVEHLNLQVREDIKGFVKSEDEEGLKAYLEANDLGIVIEIIGEDADLSDWNFVIEELGAEETIEGYADQLDDLSDEAFEDYFDHLDDLDEEALEQHFGDLDQMDKEALEAYFDTYEEDEDLQEYVAYFNTHFTDEEKEILLDTFSIEELKSMFQESTPDEIKAMIQLISNMEEVEESIEEDYHEDLSQEDRDFLLEHFSPEELEALIEEHGIDKVHQEIDRHRRMEAGHEEPLEETPEENMLDENMLDENMDDKIIENSDTKTEEEAEDDLEGEFLEEKPMSDEMDNEGNEMNKASDEVDNTSDEDLSDMNTSDDDHLDMDDSDDDLPDMDTSDDDLPDME
jgi:hypothetical protein